MRLLCCHCRSITEVDAEGEPLRCCPNCQSTAVPADADDTATVTLTKHELRILGIWASNYAEGIKDRPGCEDSPKVVYGILDHLSTQTDVALSMRQEMADVRAAFPESKVTVYRNGEETDL
ncbi:hypothetical protein [Streptomyces sp. G1]|uniref:hypothetical protein n=1 Tax=Streptomyces sp. G1 TaxID=361572 RepID=UPI00202DBC2E|nr:hypothetical protein [Streptomyces sp. G1]MCM1972342.1 hypothetical protein [Streptomyces sp. G1]